MAQKWLVNQNLWEDIDNIKLLGESSLQADFDEKNDIKAPVSPEEFLKNNVIESGLSDRDFLIMREIFRCESEFEQYWPDGTVKVSEGNIGIAQINYLAHHEEYEELGLDPYNEFDNLEYATILYKREGIIPWAEWSGHCFLPKIKDL